MPQPAVGRVFQKVLVPLVQGCDGAGSLRTAGLIAKGRSVVLVGIVPVAEEDSLSKGVLPARELRKTLQQCAIKTGFRTLEKIHVAQNPWRELINIVQDEKPSLLILESCQIDAFGI